MDNTYANAYSEVIGILDNMPKASYNKIPKKLIDNFRRNMNPNYTFKYNMYKDLESQNVSNKAKTIIAILFRDYWATEEQRNKIIEYENFDRQQNEIAKREQFNPDDIFKKQPTTNVIQKNECENTSLIVAKETIITRIMKKIKALFQKK